MCSAPQPPKGHPGRKFSLRTDSGKQPLEAIAAGLLRVFSRAICFPLPLARHFIGAKPPCPLRREPARGLGAGAAAPGARGEAGWAGGAPPAAPTPRGCAPSPPGAARLPTPGGVAGQGRAAPAAAPGGASPPPAPGAARRPSPAAAPSPDARRGW